MQNLEEIKEEWIKKWQMRFEIHPSDLSIMADDMLKKWQERELALWQAMEDIRIGHEEHLAQNDNDKAEERGYNIGISEAQSLLSVKEKEV